ncbi:uncharacterized protein LOC142173589 [Nicotiana tabacum]|uniref:Uncharacterized protein LOC142173589 n=1 Tax=Nicotiana tabacum TaxID=4097 RepID=A0AC58TDM3_TOBAC
MISNIAESVNTANKDARELSVTALLEFTRALIERRHNTNMMNATGSFTFLGKKCHKMLEDNEVLSQGMRVRSSTEYVHTVTDGCKRFIVCLRKMNCACGRFQLDELPCGHALTIL